MKRHTARELRDLDEIVNFEELREIALAIECPLCSAAVGEPCFNPFTQKEFSGPAHWQRLKEAERSTEETP